MFSKVAIPLCIPISRDDNCSASLSVLGIVSLKNFGHWNRCVVVSHCDFNLHSPKCWVSFMCLFAINLFFGEVSARIFCLFLKNWAIGTSLVAQWLRIRLPMQGTRIWSLVWEDPTCHGATKPVHHHYWACALPPVSHNYWARVPQLLKPVRLEPMLHKRNHHNEKPAHHNKE